MDVPFAVGRSRAVSGKKTGGRRRGAPRPPAEVLEARLLLSQVFTVTNTSDNTDTGSLRWAIGQVNSDGTDTPASPDRIQFDIPTTDPGYDAANGVCTIAPASALPLIDAPCVIDGYTQPGAAPGTSAGAINAVIKIELDGSNSPSPSYGLNFDQASGSSVSGLTSGVVGLAIHSFNNDVILQGQGTFVQGCFIGTDAAGAAVEQAGLDNGINISGIAAVVGGTIPPERNLISNLNVGIVGDLTELRVAGNLIGTDLTGEGPLPNSVGISLNGGGGGTIGGTTPATRNIISGNTNYGVEFQGLGAMDSVVEGNYIGTDVTGIRPLQNHADGIYFAAGTGNTIGGTIPGSANVISSNGTGIDFATGGYSSVVEGNLIGTDASGVQPLGNGGNGIQIEGGTANDFLGNTIAFNGGAGVVLLTNIFGYPTGNAILSNSIHDNAQLGIDLGGDGVTLNTPGGPHVGPNDLQNYPVLASADSLGNMTTITGTLNSTPNSTFTVQFFANQVPDPSGYGQGQTYLRRPVDRREDRRERQRQHQFRRPLGARRSVHQRDGDRPQRQHLGVREGHPGCRPERRRRRLHPEQHGVDDRRRSGRVHIPDRQSRTGRGHGRRRRRHAADKPRERDDRGERGAVDARRRHVHRPRRQPAGRRLVHGDCDGDGHDGRDDR